MPIILEALRRLEYRGYDSAGIALHRKSSIDLFKKAGQLQDLQNQLPKRNSATSGIGHTRWATHGEPSDLNAHPHLDNSRCVSIVHNGIIENATELKHYLEARGHTFASDTDSETLAVLIADEYQQHEALAPAVQRALKRVVGTYGLAVIHKDAPGQIVAARNGSPVVVGVGDHEMYVASDPIALAPFTQRVMFLEDGELVTLTGKGYKIIDIEQSLDTQKNKTITTIDAEAKLASKGEHAHFTLKEIVEQPEAIERVLHGRIDTRFKTAHFGGLNLTPKELMAFKRIKILGCGSAYIAGSVGATMIERNTRLPADAESAAEFRYRNPVIEADTLYLAVSQSGETFDTLCAVQEIQRKGGTVLGVVNVVGSSIARQCGAGIYLHAGPEVAVVSTKTFACTLAAFALFALYLGRMRDLSPAEGESMISALLQVPDQLRQLIDNAKKYKLLAEQYAGFPRAYFVGRREGYGLAREGALKLKEISYIHAEAYPASELKHGPLALIDTHTPTFAIIPDDDLVAKNLSTLAEIKARKGPTVAISQRDLSDHAGVDHFAQIPCAHELTTPMLMLPPLQFIAYFSAVKLNQNVDQPRNLAKSVTVE